MTREEIIALANDAELCQCIWIDESSEVIDSLVAFAKLVAAKAFPDGVDAEWIARRTKYAVEQEREACARVCGRLADEALVVGDENAVMCFEEAEDAIRARGEA
jgi:hypothetical protein